MNDIYRVATIPTLCFVLFTFTPAIAISADSLPEPKKESTAIDDVQPIENNTSAYPSTGPAERLHLQMGLTTMAIGAVSTLGAGLLTRIIAENAGWKYRDKTRNFWVGASLFTYPLVSTFVATSMADGCSKYKYSTGLILLGAYTGAGLAFTASMLFAASNDPKVDGKYDGGYFDQNTQNKRKLGRILFHLVLPSTLPGLMVMIAARISRKRQSIAKIPRFMPMPTVFSRIDKHGNYRSSLGCLFAGTF